MSGCAKKDANDVAPRPEPTSQQDDIPAAEQNWSSSSADTHLQCNGRTRREPVGHPACQSTPKSMRPSRPSRTRVTVSPRSHGREPHGHRFPLMYPDRDGRVGLTPAALAGLTKPVPSAGLRKDPCCPWVGFSRGVFSVARNPPTPNTP